MHGLNSAAIEPLHGALYDLAWYGGQTSVFRLFLSRLGVTVSEETGRIAKIFQALEGNPMRVHWLIEVLMAGCFIMYVFDNLDWRGKTNRVHSYQHSAASGGIYMLNTRARSSVAIPLRKSPASTSSPAWTLWSKCVYTPLCQ